jgi:hypothetical protein
VPSSASFQSSVFRHRPCWLRFPSIVAVFAGGLVPERAGIQLLANQKPLQSLDEGHFCRPLRLRASRITAKTVIPDRPAHTHGIAYFDAERQCLSSLIV